MYIYCSLESRAGSHHLSCQTTFNPICFSSLPTRLLLPALAPLTYAPLPPECHSPARIGPGFARHMLTLQQSEDVHSGCLDMVPQQGSVGPSSTSCPAGMAAALLGTSSKQSLWRPYPGKTTF